MKKRIRKAYNSADKPNEKGSEFIEKLRELLADVQMSRGEIISTQIKGKAEPIMICREVIVTPKGIEEE
jgi:hypothetical protein